MAVFSAPTAVRRLVHLAEKESNDGKRIFFHFAQRVTPDK
jgi:hypothetical protein